MPQQRPTETHSAASHAVAATGAARTPAHGVCAALRPFGTTIFTTISALAQKHGAVNLGQGFPDFDGPEFAKEAAIEAIRAGHGQYARMAGVPLLAQAIARRFEQDSGIAVDWEREVTVTSGCTEAIAAALIGLLEPGDEIVLVEPFYDSYRACVAMARAVPRFVRLRPPDFRLEPASLDAAIGPRTRAILINSPHNPTGRVLDEAELALVARRAIDHDLLVLSDEVYERLVFSGRHRSIATLPGMGERTVVLSSLGKTYSLTGWKIGWSVAPPGLSAAVRSAHQFLTFATATPLQHAAAAALGSGPEYDAQFLAEYARRRALLLEELEAAGLPAFAPQGTYFAVADARHAGFDDAAAFCTHLIEQAGVAAIPVSVFLSDGGVDDPASRSLVRFAFCKREETTREAGRRLRAWRQGRPRREPVAAS